MSGSDLLLPTYLHPVERQLFKCFPHGVPILLPSAWQLHDSSCTVSCACMHTVLARCLPPPPARSPPPHRVPCLRPSAARARLQPAPELGHLPRHGHALHVYRALLFAPRLPNLHSRALYTARCVCTAIVPVHIYMLLAPQSSAHRTPPLRMCPSFASAADRGWPAHLRKPQPTSNRSPQPIRRMPGT